MTLGQVVPPNTLEMTSAEIEQLESIDGVTVARLTLAPPKMRELIDTLQRNYEQYLALVEDQTEASR